ncbi:hypothetical protein QTP86_019501, partial [Hemibagrus guttatus]
MMVMMMVNMMIMMVMMMMVVVVVIVMVMMMMMGGDGGDHDDDGVADDGDHDDDGGGDDDDGGDDDGEYDDDGGNGDDDCDDDHGGGDDGDDDNGDDGDEDDDASVYYSCYDSESMFMPVPEPSQDFVPVNQFPSPKQTAAQWKRETPPHPDAHRLPHWCLTSTSEMLSFSTPPFTDPQFYPPFTDPQFYPPFTDPQFYPPFTDPQFYPPFTDPQFYPPFIDPQFYPPFTDPQFYPPFIDPQFYCPFTDPQFYPPFTDPQFYPPFIDPQFYPPFTDPQFYPPFTDPQFYPPFIDPQFYPPFTDPQFYPPFTDPQFYPPFIDPQFYPPFTYPQLYPPLTDPQCCRIQGELILHNIIQRFRESGTISVRKGQGQKTILDARDLRALRRHCITYRNATVMEITTWAQEYFQKTLSVNTIHRAIRRRRLKLYRSKKKPYLNMIQKRRCFLWAKAHLKWTVAKWKTVLWSDKSKRIKKVLFEKLGRRVIRTKEDKDNPSCYQRSVQKPASLMQTYPVPGLSDEDFNIPPITPPSLTHLGDSESGSYHPLCPPAPHTLHPFNMQGMDLPNMAMPGVTGQDGNLLGNSSLSVMQQMVNSDSRYSGRPHGDAVRPRVPPGMVSQGQLTPVNQLQLSTQLGMSRNTGNNGNSGAHGSPSPPESKSATPSPSSSVHEDDADEALKSGAEKRAATDVAKKPKTPKKKKKKDPNEPQKPVSAYALFFRDTQAAIKGQNPNATFGEVSKIVASMWDGLGEEQKQVLQSASFILYYTHCYFLKKFFTGFTNGTNLKHLNIIPVLFKDLYDGVYKKKTETAKKEYLKQLAAYRATLVSQSYSEPGEVKVSQTSQMLGPKPSSFQSHPGLYMAPPYPQQPHLPPMQPGLTRGGAPRQGANISMGNMAATTPPPLQISPPLHQHISMQQQMGSHAMPLHSPSMAQLERVKRELNEVCVCVSELEVRRELERVRRVRVELEVNEGFPLQAEYQSLISVSSPSMDYRSGCRTGPSQGLDWTTDYCTNRSD